MTKQKNPFLLRAGGIIVLNGASALTFLTFRYFNGDLLWKALGMPDYLILGLILIFINLLILIIKQYRAIRSLKQEADENLGLIDRMKSRGPN